MSHDPVRDSASIPLTARSSSATTPAIPKYRDDLGVFLAIASVDGSMASATFGGFALRLSCSKAISKFDRLAVHWADAHNTSTVMGPD